jgi:hypothetical protein
MPNVTLMPHTAVKAFNTESVEVEKDGEMLTLEPFQTVIFASGMLSSQGPDEAMRALVSNVEIIGDAREVHDIFSAVRAGYELAVKY